MRRQWKAGRAPSRHRTLCLLEGLSADDPNRSRGAGQQARGHADRRVVPLQMRDVSLVPLAAGGCLGGSGFGYHVC